MKTTSSRREFLHQSGALGAAYWVGGSAVRANYNSPNERLNIAAIGVGGKGSSDSDHAAEFGNLVAICDIDNERLETKSAKHPQAKKFHDFRKLFDQMANQIDAVVVSTPDHTHAPASIQAMKLGKHVYCQKPLTHSVYEARLMRETAAKYKVATQMGNQGTAHDGFRTGVEVLQSGAIGKIREAHIWTNRPAKYWKQAPDVVTRPSEKPDVPKHIHWNEFLGPAPIRPYHPIYHPMKWRGWWDFGTGALGDMGCHTANQTFMALKLGYPTSVVAENSPLNDETYPAWATVQYEFPARGNLPPVKLTWYEGAKDGARNLPSNDLVFGEDLPTSGCILVGDKGVFFSPNDYGGEYKLLPGESYENYDEPTPTLARTDSGNGGHDLNQKREWIEACKGGPAAFSNFHYAGLLTETILLGNVAVKAGKKIYWDGPKFKITNAPEAEQFLHTDYRTGWTI